MDKEMTIDDLKDVIGEVLIFCCEHGMEAPFAMEAVGAADNILAFQYILIDDQGTLAGQSLSEHYEDETFRTPIDITITDQLGERGLYSRRSVEGLALAADREPSF